MVLDQLFITQKFALVRDDKVCVMHVALADTTHRCILQSFGENPHRRCHGAHE